MSLITIREALEKAWDLDTTYSVEDYYGQDGAWGQCAVTALVLQDVLGGELKRGWAIGRKLRTRHYWNFINELDVDLTWRQFPIGTKLIDTEFANRKQLLKNDWMKHRYEVLAKRYYQINNLR